MTEVIIDVLVSAVLFASAFISIRSINGDKETTATVEKIKYTNETIISLAGLIESDYICCLLMIYPQMQKS